MSLQLSTDAGVEIWNALFSDLRAEAQDLQLLPQSWPISLKTRSVKIDEQKLENHLEAQLRATLKFDDKHFELRNFRSQEPLVAINEGSQDILKGFLMSSEDSRLKLRIEAYRRASPTAELAAQNSWKGTLYFSDSLDSRERVVGSFEGKTQFLDSQK